MSLVRPHSEKPLRKHVREQNPYSFNPEWYCTEETYEPIFEVGSRTFTHHEIRLLQALTSEKTQEALKFFLHGRVVTVDRAETLAHEGYDVKSQVSNSSFCFFDKQGAVKVLETALNDSDHRFLRATRRYKEIDAQALVRISSHGYEFPGVRVMSFDPFMKTFEFAYRLVHGSKEDRATALYQFVIFNTLSQHMICLNAVGEPFLPEMVWRILSKDEQKTLYDDLQALKKASTP